MTRLLDIGVSGLNVHQRALTTTGHNISNANTEGYSRQEVSFASQQPQFRNGVFVGSGVTVDAIRRITDQFLVAQSFVDTSRVNELTALDEGLTRLDQLLSGESTGLSASLNGLFNSLQAVTESPSSRVLRDQVLNSAESYVTRYDAIVDQIESIAGQVDSAMAAQIDQINNITSGIADLNSEIAQSSYLPVGSQPNDLFDQRDLLLKELSQYVGFTTSSDNSGAINVFVGGGQALVLGDVSARMAAVGSSSSGNRLDIAIQQQGSQQIITDRVTGGQLGGLLQLRESGIESSLNQLGLLQTQLSYTFNAVHRQGVDLNGVAGGDFFTSVNDRVYALGRVTPSSANASDSSVVSVTLNEPSNLTISDYELRLSDANGLLGYSVVRQSDGSIVARGAIPTTVPQTITVSDGFSINLESGSFQPGDNFTLRPTRVPAGSVELQLVSPESLALGLPIATSAAQGNLGQAIISQVENDSLSGLSLDEQQLVEALRDNSPPLVVRFTSDSTYDILDNSDPTQPIDLVPPLQNFSFVPGQITSILDLQPGSSTYTTSGAFAFTAASGAIGTTNNGYAGESITINTTDPNTGVTTTQNVIALAGESAATVAARISAAEGVSATANTELSLSISDDGIAPPLELRLNGVELTSTTLGAVPSPVDADFLASRINSLFSGGSVVAQSDGTNLSIRSLTGEDITLENFGAGIDSISLTSVNGTAATIPVVVGQEVAVAGTLSVIADDQVVVNSSGGFLGGSSAQAVPAFIGYSVQISGQPQAGDEFFVANGSSGSGDSRNALALVGLQTADVLSNGTSLTEIYSVLVGDVGGKAGSVSIDKQAAESILTQTETRLSSVSGVNLDEEAAKLLQYEQAYNASARVISIARSLLDTLLGAF